MVGCWTSLSLSPGFDHEVRSENLGGVDDRQPTTNGILKRRPSGWDHTQCGQMDAQCIEGEIIQKVLNGGSGCKSLKATGASGGGM